MSTNAQLKQQRARLFHEQGGLCYWCSEPMFLPDEYAKSGIPPANYCTIDHLRDRFNPLRREPNHKRERRRVAACSECNFARSQAVLRQRGVHMPNLVPPAEQEGAL